MKTKTIKLYEFKELNTTQQAKALERYRDWNIDGCKWWDCEYSDLMEKAKAMGIYINYEDIYFSGFSSQGDGACFKADIDISEFINVCGYKDQSKELLKAIENGISPLITVVLNGSRFSHEETMVIGDLEDNGIEGDALDQFYALESPILAKCKELARELYEDLQKEYEYLTSDEALTEFFMENDYYFTEDGKMENLE